MPQLQRRAFLKLLPPAVAVWAAGRPGFAAAQAQRTPPRPPGLVPVYCTGCPRPVPGVWVAPELEMRASATCPICQHAMRATGRTERQVWGRHA